MADRMRVSVEDNEPGEILRKLPEIVRHLIQLDGSACACGHVHDHDEPGLSKSVAAGEPDPAEAKFRSATALAMYRKAKAAGELQARAMVADIRDCLADVGGV